MTDVVVPFSSIAAARSRIKAADSLRSCLQTLADEAERGAFPLTATMIGLAVMAIEHDLAIQDDAAGGG
jgi:hypothetical protein